MNSKKALGLAVAFGVASLGGTAMAQDWSEDFDSYSNGQVLYDVGGWSGWDNDINVAGSASNVYSRSAPHSILCELSDDAVHQFTGLTSGAGTISAWMYIPVDGFVATTYFIVQNVYAHGGPYDWCIEVSFNFAFPAYVLDDFREETNQIEVIFDQWVEIRCEVDIDNDTITTYYNNVELSSGILFVDAGVPEIANLDLYTTGTSTYYDDISVLGLGSGGGGYSCTVTGNCPGTVNVAWDNAQPRKTQGIVFASAQGSFAVPGGPCQGTVLGLGSRNLRLVNTISTGSGTGSVNGQTNSGACGGFLQLVTVASPCETSTVGQIP